MITASALEVTAPGGRRLLDHVDLDVSAGTRHALVGPSGAGKTTLAMSLVGAWSPSLRVEGSVRLGGRELVGTGERLRRSLRRGTVAVLGQDPGSALTPTRTVAQAVSELAPGALEVAPRLAEVGLGAEYADRRPAELSGGQQRRVALARALAADPQVLVVDEPTAGLDDDLRDRVLALLQQVVAERGLTLLLVTHDLAAAQRLDCRIRGVSGGRLGEAATRQRPVPAALLPASGEQLLRARGLEVVTPGGQPLLAGADLELATGEVATLSGPSGSGKSSLARALTGFAPARSGSIELAGRSLALDQRERPRADRRCIQLVHQDSVDALNPHVPVGQAIARAVAPTRARRADRAARVNELLGAVGLQSDVRTRRPRQLSGGQRQRVILARTLAADPQVLVCDETTVNLDDDTREDILELLWREVRGGRAVLVLSHDPAVLAHGRVAYRIEDRRLLATSRPEPTTHWKVG